MDACITTVEFESLLDKELSALNGVFRIFETLNLDKAEQQSVIAYLNDRIVERAKNES